MVFTAKEAFALKIAGGIIRAQRRIAAWLHRGEQKLTIRQKKLALILFCLAGVIYCGHLLVHALTAPLPHSFANHVPINPINPIDPILNMPLKK